LRALREVGSTTPSGLAKDVALSQGTVTGIIDRLAARQLVTRERNPSDRRLVTVALTEAGEALISQAPSPLQEQFSRQLVALDESEQEQIRDTLQRIVQMMGGEELQAAPILSTSPTAQSAEELEDVIETGETAVSVIAELAPAIEPSDS
jgi:DNA-binding MarR family transcriptional regulator